MTTLSQSSRHLRFNWRHPKLSRWAYPFMPDEPNWFAVRLTDRHIHFGWFYRNTQQPNEAAPDAYRESGLCYTLDRAQWASADPQHKLWAMVEETCWALHKPHARTRIERAITLIDSALEAFS